MARIPIEDENESRGDEAPGAEAAAEQAFAPDNGADAPAPDAGAGGAGAGGEELEKLRAERDDLYQRLARATAEFKNSQRRMQADMDQRLQYANSTVIKSLLPVIDNFERALSTDPAKADAASILKGMQIVHDQLISVLRGQSVLEIAPKPGEPFDPSRHEALMQQDAPQYTEPTVVQLLQKGYALHDRTLRPAQVAVSRTS